MNNALKDINNKNEGESQPISTLFYGERLCLSTSNFLSNEEYLLSGHGHFLEFYSKNSCSNPVLSFNVFPNSKSNIHGVLPFLNNKVLFCFGEKECVILFLDNISKHKGNNKISLNLKYKFEFNHWISAVKILSHSKVLLHFTTNCLKLFNFGPLLHFGTNELFNILNFEEKSIQLESKTIITSSILDGDNWESLKIFAGTSLGAIHLFSPAKNGIKIVRTFHGNNGMSFAIRSHQNFLFSVGDDRSLRVWSKNTGKQICEKFSHGARIFALEFLAELKLIFTAGMNENICIWKWTELNDELIDVNLLKKINICDGSFGTIRAIQPCFNQTNGNINLILASEKGGLAKMSFFLNLDVSKQPFLPRIKVNTFVFVKSAGQQYKLLYLIDKFRHLQIFKLSDEFGEFTLLSKLSSKINAQLLIHNNGQQFRPDLFSYSTKLDVLAICTKKALFILKIFPIANSNQKFDFNFVMLEGVFLQLIWIQPNDCHFLLTVKTNGEAVIFDFSQSIRCERLHFHQFTQFQLSKNVANFPQIQSTLLFQQLKNWSEEKDEQTICLFFLGTRSGTILAYSFCKETANCICIYREAHGNSTVTELNFEPTNTTFIDGKFNGEFHSLGRDGTLRKWKWQFKIDQNEFDLSLCSLHRLNFEWPSSFLQDVNRRLIAGFQSDEFVLFDEKTNSILSRMKCGGGNRHWQLLTPYDNNHKYGLAFTQNSLLHFMPLSSIQIDLIKAPSHSENIITLTALSTQNGWIILTGSLDRRISSFLLKHENEDVQPELIQKSSIQMHRSNIETICLSRENNMILTGGGRSELFCWNLDEKSNLNFIFSYKLESANDIDIRLISICSLDSKFTIVLCSDGTIRLIRFSANSTLFECARFLIPTLDMFSAIQLAPKSIHYESELNSLLFAISTAGHLHTFRIETNNSQHMQILPLHPPFIVEFCGLSVLSIQSISGNNQIIFIGSESGKLSIIEHSHKLGLINSTNWHASTITAIQSYSNNSSQSLFSISTIGLDCRFCFGQFNSETDCLNFYRQIPLGISDPAALLILPIKCLMKDKNTHLIENLPKNELICIVSGNGLECIHINNPSYNLQNLFNK